MAAASAGPATAATSSIEVRDANGTHDPVVYIDRTFTVLVQNATMGSKVYVKVHPVGHTCGSSVDSDSGGAFVGGFHASSSTNSISGNGAVTALINWRSTTPEVYCTWVAANTSTMVTPATQTLTFRSPSATASATATTPPVQGKESTFTVTGTSEASATLWAAMARPGGACNTVVADDVNVTKINGVSVQGSFTQSFTYVPEMAGTYTVCMWVAQSAGSKDATLKMTDIAVAAAAGSGSGPGTGTGGGGTGTGGSGGGSGGSGGTGGAGGGTGPGGGSAADTALDMVSPPAKVRRGAKFVLAANVSADRGTASGSCIAERRVGSQWKLIARTPLAAGSTRCRVSVKLTTKGRVALRLRFAPTAGFRPSTGRTVSITVT